MENLFENLFPITKSNQTDKETIDSLVLENNKLRQSLKSEHTYNMKRKKIVEVLSKRVEEQKALLDRMSGILKSQNEALLNANKAIDIQTEQIQHYERIVNRMRDLKAEQCKILHLAHYRK